MDVRQSVKDKANYGNIVTYYKEVKEFDIPKLAELIGVTGEMSEEIYEHYRALCDIFKREVKQVLKKAEAAGGLEKLLTPADKTLFLQTIRQACETKVLLTEKYKYLYEGI